MSPRRPTLAIAVALALVVAGAAAYYSTRAGSTPSAKTTSAGRISHAPKAKGNGKAAVHARRNRETEVTMGPDGPQAAWVIAENRRPGTTAWKITGAQTPTGIAGYASRVQTRDGQQVSLFVSTQAPTFSVAAYRMGYYRGKGARLVWTSRSIAGTSQPPCPVAAGINMVQCSWTASTTFTVTSRWVQGQYLLKLTGSGNQQSYVPLTVWDPTSHAAYVVMDGVITDQVFNPYGGYDLYQGATPCAPGIYPCSTRSRVVSFDRPYASGDGAGDYLSLIYPLTRLMEERGLDVTYWTDITLAEHGNLLTDHRVLISTGHDEEWSLSMRQAAVTAADHGVNLIFFGASPILRKVRLQPSPLGPDMQIVNYRDPTADPLHGVDTAHVSQNWWGQPPANLPASTLVGESYKGFNNTASFPLVISDAGSWLFAGTGLAAGAQVPGVLSTDFDAYAPTRATSNPPDVEILAHSPVTIQLHPGPRYADTSYYTMASSNAGIFESGANSWIPSIQTCAAGTSCSAPTMQALTLNVMRVFGAGPVGLTYPSQANWQQFYA